MNRIWMILSAAVILGACTSTIKSDVTRFHTDVPLPEGDTFLIVAIDEQHEGGLEFGQYAGLLRARLTDLGYRPVESGAPDLVVQMDFSVSEGEERSRGYGGPRYAFGYGHLPGYYPYGGYGRFGHYGWPYTYGYGGYGRRSYTVYSRALVMNIETADGERVFEGRAVSSGRNKNLPEVMPYLMQAMFTNFPGESGVTKRVDIELPNGGSY